MSRVLHLITNLGQAGAERQLTYLACGLVELGWDVHLAHLEDGVHADENLDRLRQAGVTMHLVPNSGSYDWRTPLRLRRLIRQVRPDVVQTWIPMMDILGGFAALSTRTPWVVSERSMPGYYNDMPKLRFRRHVARLASAVVSNSNAANAYWAEHVSRRVQRFVVPNALPLDEIRTAPSEVDDDFGIELERPLVLFVGRLLELKNMDVLMPALEIVVKSSDVDALICGVGPRADWVAEFIRDRGLGDRIKQAGFARAPWSWMKRATVFVSVSRLEGMPNTVMEAAAAGAPLVLSPISQHTDILDADCAFYVEAETPEPVAAAILEALNDREEARARADRASARAEAWSIRRAAERYIEVYDAVRAGRN